MEATAAQNGQEPGVIPVTVEQLLARIGAQTIQIEGLQAQLAQAQERITELEAERAD